MSNSTPFSPTPADRPEDGTAEQAPVFTQSATPDPAPSAAPSGGERPAPTAWQQEQAEYDGARADGAQGTPAEEPQPTWQQQGAAGWGQQQDWSQQGWQQQGATGWGQQQAWGTNQAWDGNAHLADLRSNATVVLVLGILGLILIGPFGSIPAWVWGNSVLRRAAEAGIPDYEVSNARVGKILGIITTALWGIGLACLVFGFAAIIAVALASGA